MPLTGFQTWFADNVPQGHSATVREHAGSSVVLITRDGINRRALAVIASTDQALEALLEDLPALAHAYSTLSVLIDGRSWSQGASPVLKPQGGRPRTRGQDARKIVLRSSYATSYPPELPYLLFALCESVWTNQGTIGLTLWLCLRWDEGFVTYQDDASTAAVRHWHQLFASHPRASFVCQATSVDVNGTVTLEAEQVYATKTSVEAILARRD